MILFYGGIWQSVPGNANDIALKRQAAGYLFYLRIRTFRSNQRGLNDCVLIIGTNRAFHFLE